MQAGPKFLAFKKHPLCRDGGPLSELTGSWAGPREKWTKSGKRTHYYEVRTFRRGLQTYNEHQSQWILAIPFRVCLFDFQERQRVISEEQGALIWIPDSNHVIHQVWQDSGVSHTERAVVEQSEGTVCLDFQGEALAAKADHTTATHQATAKESMMFFDAETLRYDRRYAIDNQSQFEHAYREIGELTRIRLSENPVFPGVGLE